MLNFCVCYLDLLFCHILNAWHGLKFFQIDITVHMTTSINIKLVLISQCVVSVNKLMNLSSFSSRLKSEEEGVRSRKVISLSNWLNVLYPTR